MTQKHITPYQVEQIARALYGPRFMSTLTKNLGLSTSHSRYIKKNGLKGDNAVEFIALAHKGLLGRNVELKKAHALLKRIEK